MKRFSYFLLTAALFSLTACGLRRPSEISSQGPTAVEAPAVTEAAAEGSNDGTLSGADQATADAQKESNSSEQNTASADGQKESTASSQSDGSENGQEEAADEHTKSPDRGQTDRTDETTAETPGKEKTEEAVPTPSFSGELDAYPDYRQILTDIFYALVYDFPDEYSGKINDVYYMYANDKMKSNIRYLLTDIDKDGSKELLVGETYKGKMVLFDGFTMSGGKAKRIFTGWERNRFSLAADNTLINEGSSGASYNAWIQYRVKGTRLIPLQCIYSEYDQASNSTVWFSKKDSDELENGSPITEADAKKYMESFAMSNLPMTQLVK